MSLIAFFFAKYRAIAEKYHRPLPRLGYNNWCMSIWGTYIWVLEFFLEKYILVVVIMLLSYLFCWRYAEYAVSMKVFDQLWHPRNKFLSYFLRDYPEFSSGV